MENVRASLWKTFWPMWKKGSSMSATWRPFPWSKSGWPKKRFMMNTARSSSTKPRILARLSTMSSDRWWPSAILPSWGMCLRTSTTTLVSMTGILWPKKSLSLRELPFTSFPKATGTPLRSPLSREKFWMPPPLAATRFNPLSATARRYPFTRCLHKTWSGKPPSL